MKDTNLIPDSCNALLSSFYNPSCKSSTNLYHTLDQAQLIQRNDLKSRSTPKNLARNQPEEILLKTRLKQESIASSAIPTELFAASIAFIQDLDFYDRNRSLNHKILTQGSSYRSARSATSATRQNENATIGRTKAENPRCNAQRKGNLRRHETLTDRSLQAFLAAFAVREWARSGIRYSLKKAAQAGIRSLQLTRKPLQTEARSLRATKCSTQLIDFQARSFWQWFRQPSDLPNSGVYDRDRLLNHYVLGQRDRHKSDQVGTIDTRQNEAVFIGQEKPEYAPSRQKYAVRTKRETLTGRSLRAFLPAFAVRACDDVAYRYSLEKALQTEARSPQADSYQGRNFWQWIEPPPDIPIDILEGAAFLKKGGAA